MRSVIVGTAGHIDHGKSALVLALTGTDPDRLKEEKARGITIDLGFAHLALDSVNLAFVDVPGHERFVRNMLAGVGGIDLVLLVVAADESVMPQTREHFDICRLLHVPSGIIALTKADLVDADTLELVRLEVRDLVAGSFLERAPIVAVSSKTGEGLDALRSELVAAASGVRGRSADGATRLPIDRVFSMKGFGTVVTGTLVSGRIRVDEELAVAPGSRRVKVRGVQVHGARRDAAIAGERAAVNVGGVDVADLERGQTIGTPGAFEETRLADASLDLLAGARPLKHGSRVRFHQGTAEIMGRVAAIGPFARDGGVPSIAPGSRAFVRLRLERPALLTRGDRYILRAYSPPVTIGGGQILDPQPARTAIRNHAALDRCERLGVEESADGLEADLRAAAEMVAGAGAAGLRLASLESRAGIERSQVPHVADRLVERKAAERVRETLVAPAVVARLRGAIVDLLRAHHAADRLSEGMPREEVRERAFAHGDAEVFEHTIEHLVRDGTVAGRERLALGSHRVALSPDEDRARAVIERLFADAGLKPPDASALASQTGIAPAVADRVLKLLQRQRVLVKIDTLLFHEQALKRLKADVAALKPSEATVRIDVGMFKDRFGVTRKFAIPLLEYLDRERVTRRVGEGRVVL